MQESEEDIVGAVKGLRDQVDLEQTLADMVRVVSHKQAEAAEKLEKLLAQTFHSAVDSMGLQDRVRFLKSSQQHRLVRLLCSNPRDFFGPIYSDVNDFLFSIRNNLNLLTDLMFQCADYLYGNSGQCESLIESVTQLFFDDFGSAIHDFHVVLRRLVDRCAREPDGGRGELLLDTVFSAVVRRREVEEYRRELFAEVKADSGPAQVTVLKIWENLQRCADFLPLSLRYLLKMVVDAKKARLGKDFSEAFLRQTTEQMLVEKLLVPVLQRPFENGLAEDCGVSEASASVKALLDAVRSFWLGRPSSSGNQALNDLIRIRQYPANYTSVGTK